MRTIGRISLQSDIDDRQLDEMFALMTQYYAGVDRATFEADLAEKQWIVQIVDPDSGSVLGFSTQMLIQQKVDGRVVHALFSGDTIVDANLWGQNSLTRLWGQLALELIEQSPSREFYWFLITKGFTTYRLLPLFFNEFFPRFDRPTPQSIVRLIDALARAKYAADYDETAGIIRLADHDSCRLRPGVVETPPDRMRDSHRQFFLDRNPRHADGDELCCVAPLTRENFTRAAWRVLNQHPVEVRLANSDA